MDKKFITRKEAAELLCVYVTTIDRWVAEGRLNKIKIGRKTLFDTSDIIELIEKCKVVL